MGRIIGIDLGTTNSAVAVIEGGEPEIIPMADGRRTLPSVVAITPKGERLVGHAARRQAVMNPAGTFYSVKRLMGRRPGDSDLEPIMESLPYQVAADSGSEGTVIVLPDGTRVPPQYISAVILKTLKLRAEDYLGEAISEAVITVPAYFNDAQRHATMEAGKIAGLDVRRIINEPTAAALAYSVDKANTDRTILVYDLGGGTFDVSVLRVAAGLIKVLATDGNTWIGGDDFDRALATDVCDSFLDEEGVDLRDSVDAMARVREAVEQARIELSSLTETEINLPYIAADSSSRPLHLRHAYTQAELDDLTAPLVEATIEPVDRALDVAGLAASDVGDVLLVGGVTRMPAVIRLLEEKFGARKVRKNINPDEAVAMGAGVQAGLLSGEIRDVVILDKTAFPLGIELVGERMSVLIDANSTIPIMRTRDEYTTTEHRQTSVRIDVYQGESEDTEDNVLIGGFVFGPLRPAPAGVPRIAVSFEIDVNGHLEVSAAEVGTGLAIKYVVEHTTRLTERQMREASRWLREA